MQICRFDYRCERRLGALHHPSNLNDLAGGDIQTSHGSIIATRMHARVHMNCCSSPATRLLFQDRKKQPADPRPEHLRETPQSTRGAGGSDYRHEVMGLQLGGRPRPRVGTRSRSSIAGRFWYAQHIARNGATPSGEAGGMRVSSLAARLQSSLPSFHGITKAGGPSC